MKSPTSIEKIIKEAVRKAKLALYKKEYYESHKEEMNKYYSDYQKRNRKRITEQQRLRRSKQD